MRNKSCLLITTTSKMGERRDLNPRIKESQSNALPLGHARHFFYCLTLLYYLQTVQIFTNLFHGRLLDTL